ncbi:unnamed protein product [Adineta ricciae]|uniref:Uncharacterized protein n=1 Tax=Adineta ricciae TaxID=249248 RepID=A0A815BS63_ADIRI|nr:unnamed protein product [Adineta ricciae]
MYLIILLFYLLPIIESQTCSCSCCNTYPCTPIPQQSIYLSACTTDMCAMQCRALYTQCQSSYPNTIVAQCSASNVQLYSCRCECCNTGSVTCLPTYIGNSVSYTCQVGSCSISCANQYSTQCISNANGQTLGTCTGPITTTTTTTTIGPWLGNTCSCSCCQTGSYCTPVNVGITSASQCLTTSCTQACQARYPSMCPSNYALGVTSGTCTSSSTSGTNRCTCHCCGTTGCQDYTIRTNEVCTTCYSLCQAQSPCLNSYQVTYNCYLNHAQRLHSQFSFIFTISFLFYTIFQPLKF